MESVMRRLLYLAGCFVLASCSTALPLPVAEFADDDAFDKAVGRFHGLKRFGTFEGAQKALYAYSVLYQDEATKKRMLAQNLSEFSFYSAFGGVLAGIAKSPQGAIAGGLGGASAGVFSERYNLTVQAANYDLAAEAMRCMLNESKNFTEEGLAALTFSIAGQSVLADSEMRDIAAKNFLLVQDRLIKLQSKFVLGTPDLNKLRELAKAPADNVAVARLSVTQPAPQAEPDAEARKKDPAQAKQIDETRDLYFKELAFVQKANFEAPLQQAGAKDYRAKMAVCTAPIAG
jgi:hypothetical protein